VCCVCRLPALLGQLRHRPARFESHIAEIVRSGTRVLRAVRQWRMVCPHAVTAPQAGWAAAWRDARPASAHRAGATTTGRAESFTMQVAAEGLAPARPCVEVGRPATGPNRAARAINIGPQDAPGVSRAPATGDFSLPATRAPAPFTWPDQSQANCRAAVSNSRALRRLRATPLHQVASQLFGRDRMVGGQRHGCLLDLRSASLPPPGGSTRNGRGPPGPTPSLVLTTTEFGLVP